MARRERVGRKVVTKQYGPVRVETDRPERIAVSDAAKQPEPEVQEFSPDDLRGEPLDPKEYGVEKGRYWWTLEEDTRPCGTVVNLHTGARVPVTIHQPTGSKDRFGKVFLTLKSGEKVPVWELMREKGD